MFRRAIKQAPSIISEYTTPNKSEDPILPGLSIPFNKLKTIIYGLWLYILVISPLIGIQRPDKIVAFLLLAPYNLYCIWDFILTVYFSAIY